MSNLSSWNDTPNTSAIRDFVAAVTTEGESFVPPDERIAVFDNDGTLWCEKPVQVQIDFILQRMRAMAQDDVSLRDRQPWKSAYDKDMSWFSTAVTKHYDGDDSDTKTLLGGILQSFDTMTVDAFADATTAFFRDAKHPSLDVPYTELAFQPMVELLRYLEANEFTTYIVSGGGRDFIRPVVTPVYGLPTDRVIGSAPTIEYHADGDDGVTLMRTAGLDVLDDGPTKAVEIWNRIGRLPILAAGNANGDIPMLRLADAGPHPSLCLLVNHDDGHREFVYTAGAEKAVNMAKAREWVIVSVERDWSTVFAFQNG